jgi:leucyl-tRNA synthetase
MKHIPKKLKRSWANSMRRSPTKHEKILWEKLKYINGFCSQKIINGFIVDFAHTRSKLIIEVDGKSHEGKINIKKDKQRTKILNNSGWIVLRFKNSQIEHKLNTVLLVIDSVCNQLNINT